MDISVNRSISSRWFRCAFVGGLVLLGASCGGDDDSASATTTAATTAAAPATTAAPVPPETTVAPAATTAPVVETTVPPAETTMPAGVALLNVTVVDFTTGMATITNVGSEPYELFGHWICNRPAYEELPTDTLDPGESIEAGFDGLDPAGGEIGLYSSGDFGSSDAMVAYVTWGSGGGRLSVAETAGLWSGDPVVPAGDVIQLTGDAGTAAGWEG